MSLSISTFQMVLMYSTITNKVFSKDVSYDMLMYSMSMRSSFYVDWFSARQMTIKLPFGITFRSTSL